VWWSKFRGSHPLLCAFVVACWWRRSSRYDGSTSRRPVRLPKRIVVRVAVREWVLDRRWERMNNEARSSGSRNILFPLRDRRSRPVSNVDYHPNIPRLRRLQGAPKRYLGSNPLRHSSSGASLRALVQTARENESQIHYGTEHSRRYELISPRSLTPSQQTRCDQLRFQLGHPRVSGCRKSKAENPEEMGAWWMLR